MLDRCVSADPGEGAPFCPLPLLFSVKYSFHIFFLQVQENSPGHRAGLEPFFDFIVSINGSRLVSSAFYGFVYRTLWYSLKWKYSKLGYMCVSYFLEIIMLEAGEISHWVKVLAIGVSGPDFRPWNKHKGGREKLTPKSLLPSVSACFCSLSPPLSPLSHTNVHTEPKIKTKQNQLCTQL